MRVAEEYLRSIEKPCDCHGIVPGVDPLGQPLISVKEFSDDWDWDTIARWTPDEGWGVDQVWKDGEE